MKIKHLFVILTILLLAFVAGCGSDTDTEPVTKVVKSEPAEEPKETTKVSEPAEEEEPVVANSKDVAALLEKHKKVKNLEYMYQDPDNYPEFHQYYVKGDLMSVYYTVLDQDNPVGKIDSIYLDLGSKKAVAYCERASTTACPDRNKEHPLTYSQYIKETPIDWIQKVGAAEKTGQAQLEGRTAIIIQTTIGGKDTEMWVDDYYGLPMKVVHGDDEYLFYDISANNFDSDLLTHQHVDIV